MKINIDGLEINYRFSGEGAENAVILQGWGTGLDIYNSIAGLLAGRFRVLQFDFPGFGESDEPKEPWNVDAYTDFFLKLTEALDIHEAVLIGHSYGGRVIIKLSSRQQSSLEIKRIVLIDSAGVLPVRTLKQRIKIRNYKILKSIFNTKVFEALFPEVVEDWRSRQGSADYRNATPIMRQCLVMAVNEDLTPLLSGIKSDTLLIWGDKDTATPMRDAHIMEERIPGAGLAVLQGAGHFSFLEQPAVFAQIIRSYFGIGV